MISPIGPAAELTATASPRKGLRVRFYRDGDRFRHVVDMIVNGQAMPFLESVEGDAAHHWPPSPPFQDLQVCVLDNGKQIIFLTGRGGSSHWSASVEVSEGIETNFRKSEFSALLEQRSEVHAPQYLQFDVACRAKEAGEFVGSTYHPVAKTMCRFTEAFGFAADGQNAFMLGPDPSQLSDCVVTDGSGGDVNAILTVRPTGGQVNTQPATLRWKYVMIVTV